MNILPKKRWHVRTKDNIARVRKDEAAANELERKRQEKLQFAESEARINFLRTRTGIPKKHNEVVTDGQVEVNNLVEHVNLFADYKSHVKTTNKELENEKKEEQEKYEKQIGYLTYLGQDTNEALRLKSWYEVAPNHSHIAQEGEIVEKDLKKKQDHDPLTLINSLLTPDLKPERKSSSDRRRASFQLRNRSEDLSVNVKRAKKHKKESKRCKKERHKKHHKEKKRSKSEDHQDNDNSSKIQKLEKLRRDRLRREAIEKARQDAILFPKDSTKQKEGAVVTNRVVQKYNSQFNPELAKQNMG